QAPAAVLARQGEGPGGPGRQPAQGVHGPADAPRPGALGAGVGGDRLPGEGHDHDARRPGDGGPAGPDVRRGPGLRLRGVVQLRSGRGRTVALWRQGPKQERRGSMTRPLVVVTDHLAEAGVEQPVLEGVAEVRLLQTGDEREVARKGADADVLLIYHDIRLT